MKKYRNFKCSNKHVTERRAEDDVKEIECHCGLIAKRMLSAPRCFQNTVGKSPST